MRRNFDRRGNWHGRLCGLGSVFRSSFCHVGAREGGHSPEHALTRGGVEEAMGEWFEWDALIGEAEGKAVAMLFNSLEKVPIGGSYKAQGSAFMLTGDEVFAIGIQILQLDGGPRIVESANKVSLSLCRQRLNSVDEQVRQFDGDRVRVGRDVQEPVSLVRLLQRLMKESRKFLVDKWFAFVKPLAKAVQTNVLKRSTGCKKLADGFWDLFVKNSLLAKLVESGHQVSGERFSCACS